LDPGLQVYGVKDFGDPMRPGGWLPWQFAVCFAGRIVILLARFRGLLSCGSTRFGTICPAT
jgi:hypothetical protein